MRAIIATDGSASVTAGSTRCAGEPAPPTGSQLSQSEKTTISTSPVQKIGIESPKSEPRRASASKREVGRRRRVRRLAELPLRRARAPEVAAQQAAHVVRVADEERLVEPEVIPELGD